uniref:RPGR interacting protein 1 n=1 Tax=Poecilia formosa TaxID=48698 RepID=A0A087XFN7_POEFO
MSLVVDETAGDLPVRDVGLMRGGLMPTVPDTLRDVRPSDPQRLFRFPRDHLEDLCLRLQEENSVLRQHTRTQEERLRRMSTKLMRLRQARPGSGPVKERDMEDTIQELEARVAVLESQKEVLQNKLGIAKQHILDLGARTPYSIVQSHVFTTLFIHLQMCSGKNLDGEARVRRAARTAPARYGLTLEETRAEMERLSSMTEQVRMAELEVTAQALRESLKDREREMEGTVRELRKQQADRHRITIRENVDLIRLQKQLSEKSTALRVSQEKFADLQESQRALRESQGALLEKVEELTEQLKQERQRALTQEGQLTTMSLSLQTLDKLQERISDLEGERDLIKDSYDTLLKSTLTAQNPSENPAETRREVEQKEERLVENIFGPDLHHRLEEMLQEDREERSRLELEKEKLRQEKEMLEEQRKQDEGETESSFSFPGFDLSVEELSETLLQIKAFRMQQESREALGFLVPDGSVDDSSRELVNIQASHAETVLELQKTRNLLLLEHKITKDLQVHAQRITKRLRNLEIYFVSKEEEKDKLLSKRALQINTLQAQLKELAYSPRNYKRTIPVQYTWPAGDQEAVQPIEDDLCFSQLKSGESLLEIHLKTATFTPAGLRTLSDLHPGAGQHEDIVTFCTYCLLDFEMHSTPLVSGSQPNYGFTSRYALTVRDLGRLGGQGSRVRLELHQALGGVRFVTHGSGSMSLMGATERSPFIFCFLNLFGNEGEIIGVVDFWVRLFPPAEPVHTGTEMGAERRTATHRSPAQIPLGWQDGGQEELHDYGGGIPNELVVTLERCVGLNARWPGLLPDAYLTYRLYDLPPHVSQTVQCAVDPVFNDVTSFPLAATADVLHYLRSSSLWVYVFDDSDEQIPPAYLAKTPIPLRALATARVLSGDYVLRDPAGGPRGMVRVMLKWKYPFQPPLDGLRAMKSSQREKRRSEETSQRPTAKQRVKPITILPQPSPVKQKSSQDLRSERVVSVKPPSADRKRSTKRSSEARSPNLTPEPRLTTPSHSSTYNTDSKTIQIDEQTNSYKTANSFSFLFQGLPSVSQVSESEEEKSASEDGDAPESPESTSSQSDIVIIPPQRKMRRGDKLRVEILSLTFEPSSRVALDRSVQRVYVEYRLLGVAMETTETPMSLRKPVKGEEIHYNFTRVIYVDGSQSAPLRQYLYTMLEGTDPNRGRLKFTVVSEPMDDEEECVDVGHAFLDLQELLLTGNDVFEQQIDILSVDEDREVIGSLKVSLEAAKALKGIYQEFHQRGKSKTISKS